MPAIKGDTGSLDWSSLKDTQKWILHASATSRKGPHFDRNGINKAIIR